MDVHLLVYDLSRGLARQMSMGLLGFHLDAIYHTSIELSGLEYVYDGGIVAIQPGSSHHGQAMERIHLGKTALSLDIINDYIESVRPIYTAEAYDLFKHNCNNFTDSFSNFLVGSGIPTHISSMPQAVLDSPMGRMLLPQLTQGVNASRQNGDMSGLNQFSQGSTTSRGSNIQNAFNATELSNILDRAKDSCAVIFFTSATCPPCKVIYPVYEEVSVEYEGKATFIKVDLANTGVHPAAHQYSVRSTPTFITILKGQEETRWVGADPATLRGNVRLLVQMVNPPHPHQNLRLPSFSNPNVKPVLFTKVPPLSKLLAKMGDDIANKTEVLELKRFIEDRGKEGPMDAVIPSMSHLGEFMQTSVSHIPLDVLFGVVDLFRCALSDPRVSGYFAEEKDHKTVLAILGFVNEQQECPYALRLVTLQMACNFFSTPLFLTEVVRNSQLRAPITQLISSSFLDDSHNNVRVAASSLLFNVALANRKGRDKKPPSTLPEDDQVELAASVVEAISQEDKSVEALIGMLSALGHLVYATDLDGELADLLRALDAEGTIIGKKKAFPNEKLIDEVGNELLGKGLAKP